MSTTEAKKIRRKDIESFISEQLTGYKKPQSFRALEDVTSPAGDNIFDPYPWLRKQPHSIYLLYFKLVGRDFEQQAYYYVDGNPNRPISQRRAEEITQILTENARKPLANQVPQPLPQNDWYDNTWERISYLIVVFDDPVWRITESQTTGAAAVVFYQKGNSKPNHSFYDGKWFEINPEDPVTHARDVQTAVSMINYMVDENGVELGNNVREEFRFFVGLDVPVRTGRTRGTSALHLDPGGVNEGPPDPPPP